MSLPWHFPFTTIPWLCRKLKLLRGLRLLCDGAALELAVTVNRSGMLGTHGTTSPGETCTVLVQIYGSEAVEKLGRLVIHHII